MILFYCQVLSGNFPNGNFWYGALILEKYFGNNFDS